MKTDNIVVSVEATDGRAMRSYTHEGKTFVESHQDRVYQIRIKNKTSCRIKAVISVDSLNIVSGKPATNDPKETGYILGAHEEQIFKGYRVDNNTVAEFKFVKREKSYATEQGSGAGNGVIAVRAYEEKESESDKVSKMLQAWREAERNKPRDTIIIDRPYPVYPYRPRPWYWEDQYWRTAPYYTLGGAIGYGSSMGSTSMANLNSAAIVMNCSTASFDNGLNKCAAESPRGLNAQAHVADSVEMKAASFDMGSAWGSAVKDSVKEVEFEEGALLAEIAIYYASLDSLKEMGVNVERVKAVAFPEPFKREYCAVPSGWKKDDPTKLKVWSSQQGSM